MDSGYLGGEQGADSGMEWNGIEWRGGRGGGKVWFGFGSSMASKSTWELVLR